MAKGSNQKLKQMYLLKILREKSDEKHPLSSAQLIEELAQYGVNAERKSIYNDIEELTHFGIDIICQKGRGKSGYYIGSREFELPELKLLVDAVQSSKFITHKKTNELIKKLESMASIYDAGKLQREVFVANRVKTVNESIYYSVDSLHTAIGQNRKISFLYSEWTVDKEMQLKKSGERYVVSPFGLHWDDENYYLIAYDSEAGIVKHYRVDKMSSIRMLSMEREGKKQFEQLDMANYTRKTFGMFGGQEEVVTVEMENRLIGVVIDRFGKEVAIQKTDEEHFKARLMVQVSSQFFGWLFGLGTGVRIIGPDWVKEKYRSNLNEVLKNETEG